MKTTLRRVLPALVAGGAFACSAATIAHWTFGEHGLEDVSGHGHTLQCVNAEYSANGWVTFNGTSSYLKTASTLDLTSCRKLTVECWMKPETLTTDFGVVFVSDPPGTAGGFVLYFQKAANRLQSQFRSIPSNWDITHVTSTSLPYSEGGWHHVALVMDPSKTWSDKSQLYIDGVKIAGTSSQQNFSGTGFLNQHLYFGGGASYGEGRNFFKGGIDDIRISDEALTPDQFLKFPTVGRKMSVEKPEVAFWPFGEDGLADKTGNGFNLSVGKGGLSDLGFANGCLQLNGAANVYYPNAFPANAFSHSGLTYEFYFRTSTSRGANQFAMLFENSGSYWRYPGAMSARLHESDNRMLATALRTNTGYNSRRSNPSGVDAPLTDGEWHHVALVYDPKGTGASRCRSYLDGRELASIEGETQDDLQTLNGDCSLFLGGRAFESGTFLVGEIDDVRIMPWALAPSEFQQTHGLHTTLAHWKFNQAATALTDLSGHGYDLQNLNGVVFQDGAAVFNGENAHLITTNALAFSRCPQVTIEGRYWFEESQKLGVLFSSQHAGDVDFVGGFVVYGYLDAILSQLRVRPSTWQQCRMPNLTGALGGWHHVAYVVDMADSTSGLASLWIDGVQQSCTLANASSAGVLPDQIFSIGGGGSYSDSAWNNPSHHCTFKGRVAEMLITPAALGPSEFRLLTPPDPEVLIVRPDAAPRETLAIDLSNLTDITVECFAKFPASGAAGEIVAFTPEGAPQFVVRIENGALAARVVPDMGVSNVETVAVPTDGQWHHLAFTVDGYATRASRVRLYVDRVRATAHDTNANWTAPFRAGTLEFGAGFNGGLDSIRVTKGVVPIDEFLSERRPESTRVVFR